VGLGQSNDYIGQIMVDNHRGLHMAGSIPARIVIDANQPFHEIKFSRTGGGPPGVLFYKRSIVLQKIFRIENSLGVHPLSF